MQKFYFNENKPKNRAKNKFIYRLAVLSIILTFVLTILVATSRGGSDQVGMGSTVTTLIFFLISVFIVSRSRILND